MIWFERTGWRAVKITFIVQRLKVDLDGLPHIWFQFGQRGGLAIAAGQLGHRADQPITLWIALDNDRELVCHTLPPELLRSQYSSDLVNNHDCRRGRYWIALQSTPERSGAGKARCTVSIPSEPARSAIVRASFTLRVRWYARALICNCSLRVAARSRLRPASSTAQKSRTSAGPTRAPERRCRGVGVG